MRLWLAFAILTTFVTGVELCPFPTACENGGVCGLTSVCDCRGTGFAGTSCQEELSFTLKKTSSSEDFEEGSSVEIEISRTNTNYEVTLVGSVSGTVEKDDVTLEDFIFTNGVPSVTKSVKIINDDFFEPKENAVLSFSPKGDTYKIPQELTFNILDNDPLTVTNIRRGSFSESDGAVPLSFFSISKSEETVDITLTVSSNDASAGADYDIDSSVINFNTDNAATKLATKITFLDDSTPEPDKTLTFTFTSSTALSGDTTEDIIILDDDNEVITVSGPDSDMVDENDGLATFTLTRGISFRDAVITYTVTSNRPDGSLDSKKITEVSDVEISFKAGGSMTQSFDVKLIDDELKEPDQTFDVEFTVKSGKVQPIPSVTITVAEDDEYAVTITGGTVVEGVIFSVSVTRNSLMGVLEVTLSSIDGTAVSGTHYEAVNQVITFMENSKTVETTIEIFNDELFNYDRTFQLTATSSSTLETVTPATVTITNDDDYGVTVTAGNVLEGEKLTVTLTRDSAVGELEVQAITSDASAISGVDFNGVTATVTFSADIAVVELDIQTIEDNEYEQDETLKVTVIGSNLKATAEGNVTIVNDDVEVLTLTVGSSVPEDAGVLSVTLSRTEDFEDLDVEVTTVTETADSTDIQTLSSKTLSFGDAKTVNFEITIIDDMVAEPDETFVIRVDAPDPIVDVSANISITDNDPDTISINTFPGVAENGGSKTLTLSRTVSQKELTVTVEATDVTAKEGTDFTIDSDATFAAGSLQATFVVRVEDDDLEEGLETFSMTISGSSSEVKSDVTATFQIADNEGSRPFDCRRKNQGCESGTDICYPDFPFCVCTGGDPREGEMCNIVTSQKDGAGCPSTCTENGQCLSDGGVVSCACKPGYFGDNCENYFLKAECSSSAMKLIVNPHGDFDGVIYVAEKLGESTCRAEDGENGFAVEVAHDSTACGEISPVEGETETSYSRKFIIQYDETILTQLDQCVTVSCKFDKDDVLVDTGVVTVDPSGPLTKESTSDVFSPVSLQILDISGSPVTESMVVPISKKLCVTLSIPSAFGGLEMIDIEFNNTLKAKPKKLLVLSAGCETNKAKFVFSNPPFYVEPSNKKVIRFCFFAFKFVDIEKLAITMKVKICVKPEDCFETNCNPVRRKREAGEETRTETLGTTFTISNPAQQSSASQNGTEGGTSNVKSETTCEYPSHYLPTLIGLGVLVLLLVLLVLFLTYRLARRPSKIHHPQKPEPWFMKYPSHFSSK